MTNVMSNFFNLLSIYFCLICFGVPFSPSSKADEQFRQWFKFCGYGASNRAPETCKAEGNSKRNYKLVQYVGHYTVCYIFCVFCVKTQRTKLGQFCMCEYEEQDPV
jgi:hypothetical protein